MTLETIVICKWAEASKLQIANEIKQYGHANNSRSYYEKGCPTCDGLNSTCVYRYPKIKNV